MIDVRPRAEFEKGHASCAHRLHFETHQAARAKDDQLVDNLEMLTNGDKDFPVQVYGQSEARAGMVQNFLKGHHGYSHITNAKGWTDRQDEIEAFCKPRGIRLIAYSPLSRAKRLDNPVIQEVAKAHGATPAQIHVRWSVQHGYVPLPKSVRTERVAENIDVFKFEITPAEMEKLDALDERLFTEWEEWGNLDPTKMD